MNNSSIEESVFAIYPLTETAVRVSFGDTLNEETHERVKRMSYILEAEPFNGMVEYVPGFTSVTVFYDPCVIRKIYHQAGTTFETVKKLLQDLIKDGSSSDPSENKVVRIPVVYGGEHGLDLKYVAEHNQLSEEEVIRLHSEPTYLVYLIGFAPGFPYLGGMNKKLSTPRKETPRTKVPAGSVGIAGSQTGVYSLSTPGGWQIIGRTPQPLFQLEKENPSLLKMGDRVQFYPISSEEYEKWEGGEHDD